jgi:hypothetical protein
VKTYAGKLKLQEAAEHIGSMQAAAAAADEGRQLLLNELQDFKLQQVCFQLHFDRVKNRKTKMEFVPGVL